MDYQNTFWNSEKVKEMYELDNAEDVTLQPYVAEMIKELSPSTFLDYGCGDAPLVSLLEPKTEITLYDKNIKNLRKIFSKISKNNCKMVIDEEMIPTNYFDCINLSLVLICISSKEAQKKILMDIKKWKKKEGSLIVVITHPCFTHYEFGHYYTSQRDDDFNYFNEGVPYKVYMKRGNKKPLEFNDHFWTLSSYVNLFVECGYTIKKMIELPDFPYNDNKINNHFSPFLIFRLI